MQEIKTLDVRSSGIPLLNNLETFILIDGTLHYYISSEGRLANDNKEKIYLHSNATPKKKSKLHWKIYYEDFDGSKVPRDAYADELVAEMFLEKVDGKNRIYHIDGNTSNNKYTNLMYVDDKEAYQLRNGIITVEDLRPAFQKAVDDDWIRKNPCTFKLDFLPKQNKPKIALSQSQEKEFLAFVKQNEKLEWYYDIYVLMLETGMRLSETVGLTLADIDLGNRRININQQLCRNRKSANKDKRLYIDTLKTENGKREIYISDRAYRAILNLLERRKQETNIEVFIDGYSNFLLTSHKQTKIVTHEMIYRHLKDALKMYNDNHKEKIPDISPHILRHTFCTRMVENEMSIKTLQYVMGHSDISTTLNTYTHWDGDKAMAEMQKAVDKPRKKAR